MEANLLDINLSNISAPTGSSAPVQKSRAHFSGCLMGGKYEAGISEAYKTDKYSEYVGIGSYANNKSAFPKAVNSTFDGIAIDKNTRVVIYEKPNFGGKILLDKNGPAIINNVKWAADNRYNKVMTEKFPGNLQNNFPPSVRQWSSSDMHQWSYGSVKIFSSQYLENSKKALQTIIKKERDLVDKRINNIKNELNNEYKKMDDDKKNDAKRDKINEKNIKFISKNVSYNVISKSLNKLTKIAEKSKKEYSIIINDMDNNINKNFDKIENNQCKNVGKSIYDANKLIIKSKFEQNISVNYLKEIIKNKPKTKLNDKAKKYWNSMENTLANINKAKKLKDKLESEYVNHLKTIENDLNNKELLSKRIKSFKMYKNKLENEIKNLTQTALDGLESISNANIGDKFIKTSSKNVKIYQTKYCQLKLKFDGKREKLRVKKLKLLQNKRETGLKYRALFEINVDNDDAKDSYNKVKNSNEYKLLREKMDTLSKELNGLKNDENELNEMSKELNEYKISWDKNINNLKESGKSIGLDANKCNASEVSDFINFTQNILPTCFTNLLSVNELYSQIDNVSNMLNTIDDSISINNETELNNIFMLNGLDKNNILKSIKIGLNVDNMDKLFELSKNPIQFKKNILKKLNEYNSKNGLEPLTFGEKRRLKNLLISEKNDILIDRKMKNELYLKSLPQLKQSFMIVNKSLEIGNNNLKKIEYFDDEKDESKDELMGNPNIHISENHAQIDDAIKFTENVQKNEKIIKLCKQELKNLIENRAKYQTTKMHYDQLNTELKQNKNILPQLKLLKKYQDMFDEAKNGFLDAKKELEAAMKEHEIR